MENKKLLEPGEYFDSHNGVYNMPSVIRLAVSMGFKMNDEDVSSLGASKTEDISDDTFLAYENICELCSEAEQYLSSNCCPEGFYFGCTESCDWGVWSIEGED